MLNVSCVVFFCRPEPFKTFILRDHLATGKRCVRLMFDRCVKFSFVIRMVQIPLIQNFALIIWRKLLLRLWDRFSRKILEV